MAKRIGESAPCFALRSHTVSASRAIEAHLIDFGQHLKQNAFITNSTNRNILSGGGSNAEKAGKFLDVVEEKVNSAESGSSLLKTFVEILIKVGEDKVAKDIAATYVTSAENGDPDYEFFSEVAKKGKAVGEGASGVRDDGPETKPEENEESICDNNDDLPKDEGGPKKAGEEEVIVRYKCMWKRRPTRDRGSAPTVRVFFMKRVPFKDSWRMPNEDLISTEYIIKTANQWHWCGETVVPEFLKVDDISESDIRILFDDTERSKSAIGRNALNDYKPEERTMVLNLGTDHQDYTILHEFGHALGIRHEQHHPERHDDLYPAKKNDVPKFPKDGQHFFAKYDLDSVMHYRYDVARKYQLKRGAFRGKLSPGDKESIVQAYTEYLKEDGALSGAEDEEGGGPDSSQKEGGIRSDSDGKVSDPIATAVRQPDPGVFIKRKMLYTGKKDNLIWDEYGITLHLPAAPSETNIEISVAVVTNIDKHFILPQDHTLVSAMYKISVSDTLPVPVTVLMQHCVPLSDKHSKQPLTFVTAHSVSPHKFRALLGGTFLCESSYGEIEMSKFCFLAIIKQVYAWWYEVRLCVRMFYHHDNTANFVVTKDLNALIEAVKDSDDYKNAKPTPTNTMTSSAEAINLALPDDTKGWEITPVSTPMEIKMTAINGHNPGTAIPNIGFQIRWPRKEEAHEDDIELKIDGGSLKSYILHCAPSKEQLPGSAAATNAAPTSGKTGNIDPENSDHLVEIGELLKHLKNEELKKLFMILGLSLEKVEDQRGASKAIYRTDLIESWAMESDKVTEKGGATWKNLKAGLIKIGHNRIAGKI